MHFMSQISIANSHPLHLFEGLLSLADRYQLDLNNLEQHPCHITSSHYPHAYFNADSEKHYTLYAPHIAWIGEEKNYHAPQSTIVLSPQQIEKSSNIRTHNIKHAPENILLFIHSSGGNAEAPIYICDSPTKKDIELLKSFGNSATIFIHGFNVEAGSYSERIIDIQKISSSIQEEFSNTLLSKSQEHYLLKYQSGISNYILKTIPELQAQIPKWPDHKIYNLNNQSATSAKTLIEDLFIGNPTATLDSTINGTGMHQWAVHMQHNLNCSACNEPLEYDYFGNPIFPWEKHGDKYAPIISISWPGNTGYGNFKMAQKRAHLAGIALSKALEKISFNGISINIITHSLGAHVALSALQHLHETKSKTKISKLILWQPAISDTAFSEHGLDKEYTFPNAAYHTKKIIVLFSHTDAALAVYNTINVEKKLVRIKPEMTRGTKPINTDLEKCFSMYQSDFSTEMKGRPALGQYGLIGLEGNNYDSKEKTLVNNMKLPSCLKNKYRQYGQVLFEKNTSHSILKNHSSMLIPTPELMDHVYRKIITSEISFGRY